MKFDIDFGNALQPLFAAMPGIPVSLGSAEVAYQLPEDGETHVMTAEVHRALAACRAFRPLDEHVDQIVRLLPQLADKRAAVRGVLEGLAKRGLLRTADDYAARLARPVPSAPPPFRATYIRACDRPEQLRDLLDSLRAYERRFGVARRWVVLDDSRDPAAAAANAAQAARLRDEGLDLVHVDAVRWARLVETLSAELPAQADSLRYALAREDARGPRRGPGKGLNLALLLGAGARFALLDEDFVFDLRRVPGARSGIELGNGLELPVWLGGSRADVLGFGAPLEDDPIALHLGWCGRHLGELAHGGGQGLAAEGLRGFVPALEPKLGAASRVLATDHGHRGSPRAAGIDFLFGLPELVRSGPLRDAEAFARALADPQLCSGTPRARVLPHANLTPFMLDGGALLPPTLPLPRGEDLALGALMRLAHPASVLLNANLTIAHLQEAGRPRGETLRQPWTPGLADLVVELARARAGILHDPDPAHRLALFGALLGDVAAGPLESRRELLSGFVAQQRARHVQFLQDALVAVADAPAHWRETIRDAVLVSGRPLTHYTVPRLAEWPESLDERGGADRLAEELGRFGALLRDWPAIRAHAASRGEALLDV